MTNTIRNPIGRFTKLNHVYLCSYAFEIGDIKNFCRHFFSHVMNRNGLVEFRDPIVVVIARLTGWQKTSICRAIRVLSEAGELTRPKENDRQIVMNELIYNREGRLMSSKRTYDGKDPAYAQRQLTLITEMSKLVSNKQADEAVEQAFIDNARLLQENHDLRLQIARLEGGALKAEEILDKCLDKMAKGGESDPTPPRLQMIKNASGSVKLKD